MGRLEVTGMLTLNEAAAFFCGETRAKPAWILPYFLQSSNKVAMNSGLEVEFHLTD